MRNIGAYPIYLVLSGTMSLCFSMVFTIEMVYQIKAVGLNPLQLVIVGTVLQCVHIVFQTPMGILADMYSRRLAVVIGLFLLGAGYVVEGSQATFTTVLAGTAIGAFGYTIVSGADSAWIADELGTDRVGHAYLRAAQVGSIAGLPGIAISAALGSVHLNLPIILAGSLFIVLSFVLALLMPERHFTPAARADRNSWQQMGHTLRASVHLIRLRPALLTILGIGVFYSVFSAGFDRLWSFHLLAHFTFPSTGGLTVVIWFGIIEAGINVANLCGTEIARRRVDWKNRRAVVWALFSVDALTLVCVAGFTVAGQFGLALGLFWLSTVARGPRGALETTWMNLDLDSSVRATVFSMRAQVGALAGIVGGPILGAIATDHGTGAALIAAAAALAPALLLYLRSLSQGGKITIPESPAAQP
jgi:DHA3 family tetracycline resistance protein-like MFS transporter